MLSPLAADRLRLPATKLSATEICVTARHDEMDQKRCHDYGNRHPTNHARIHVTRFKHDVAMNQLLIRLAPRPLSQRLDQPDHSQSEAEQRGSNPTALFSLRH